MQPATLADIVMGLAWYAHSRADLISPALLESYDPDRKYSFVGWPEEFREASSSSDGIVVSGPSSGNVLEVFGTDRKFSFVGEPESIADNIAFAFSAWQAEIDLSERLVTQPFMAMHGQDGEKGRALSGIAGMEAAALARRRFQTYTQELEASAGGGAPLASAYANALRVLDDKLRLPGFATLNPVSEGAVEGSRTQVTLHWGGTSTSLPAGHAEELRAGLRRLYAERFR